MGGGGEGQSVLKAEQPRIRCMKAYNVYIFFPNLYQSDNILVALHIQ